MVRESGISVQNSKKSSIIKLANQQIHGDDFHATDGFSKGVTEVFLSPMSKNAAFPAIAPHRIGR